MYGLECFVTLTEVGFVPESIHEGLDCRITFKTRVIGAVPLR